MAMLLEREAGEPGSGEKGCPPGAPGTTWQRLPSGDGSSWPLAFPGPARVTPGPSPGGCSPQDVYLLVKEQ